MVYGTSSSRRMPAGMVVMFGIKWIQFMLTAAALMYIFVLPTEIIIHKMTRPGNDTQHPSEFFPDSEAVTHYDVAVLPWLQRFCPTGTCWSFASLVVPSVFSVLGFVYVSVMGYQILMADRVWNEKQYRAFTVANFLIWITVSFSLGLLLNSLDISINNYDSAFYTSLILTFTCLVEVIATFLFETTSEYVPMQSEERETNEVAYVRNIIEHYERNDDSRKFNAPNTDVYRTTVV